MSCKDCKYSPKTYEEYFMGGSCPDAFTGIAVNCGMFDQSNKNKEKQGGKANCRFCKDLIIDDISLADHFRIRSMDVYQDFKFIHTKGWRLMSLEDEEGYPLNFCPECGRDLRKEEKMDAKEMLEKVQDLKEQVVLNNFEKTADIEAFFNEYWMQILDILDDALYAYLGGGS